MWPLVQERRFLIRRISLYYIKIDSSDEICAEFLNEYYRVAKNVSEEGGGGGGGGVRTSFVICYVLGPCELSFAEVNYFLSCFFML